jgi:hypothetical protein
LRPESDAPDVAFGRLPTWQSFFPQTYFISLATLYLALFASAFMSSLDLAYYSFLTKAPNHAMQLTQHFVATTETMRTLTVQSAGWLSFFSLDDNDLRPINPELFRAKQ